MDGFQNVLKTEGLLETTPVIFTYCPTSLAICTLLYFCFSSLCLYFSFTVDGLIFFFFSYLVYYREL